MLNRFEREHVDGLGDGLSIALGIVTSSKDLREANNRVLAALRLAREAKDRENLAQLRELAGVPGELPGAPLPR